jgi:lysophospholipase L1-like esterase
MRAAAACLIVLTLTGAAGCSSGSPNQPTQSPTPTPTPTPAPPPEPPPGGPAAPPPAPVPRVGKVRFVAFGDSLTEGTISAPLTLRLVNIPHAYPARLQDALRARYKNQPEIVVANEGKAGESAIDARSRLIDAIKANNPEVLILMDGANDLLFYHRRGISRVVGGVEDMIKEARGRGVTVIVASLPPQRAGGLRAEGEPYLAETNAALRATAAEEGAGFVDVNAQLDLSYVGQDGLHLTEAGYARLAEIFAGAIRAAFELPPAS